MTRDVRKELKAVVGARSNQRLAGPALAAAQVLNVSMNQSMAATSMMNNNSSPMMPGGQPLNQADLEAFGLSLELPQGTASITKIDTNGFD